MSSNLPPRPERRVRRPGSRAARASAPRLHRRRCRACPASAALAGGVLLFGAYTAWRQLQQNAKSSREQHDLDREGQLTERFTHAIDQLGTKDQLEVVLGGIYALDRIARDSPLYRPIIAEVLTAYVRTHAPRPIGPDQHKAEDSFTLQTRAANIQAALVVLGGPTFDMELDLRGTDLRNADLKGAKFKDVRLYNANLQGARFQGADLQGARLRGADLRGALADGTTKWPDGFDASAAGVLLSEEPTADRPP